MTKEKMTVPVTSVGADGEQPLRNFKTNQSITDLPGKAICKPQIIRKMWQNQQIKRIRMNWKLFP